MSQAPEQASPDRWRVAGASVTGVSHEEAGEPCDDAWFVGQLPTGIVVAVVSDGAGSASMGAFAARTICDAFEEVVAPSSGLTAFIPAPIDGEAGAGAGAGAGAVEQPLGSWHDIQEQIDGCLATARARLLDHAAASGAQPDDYLATVVGVVAHSMMGVLSFHIGDGAATVFGKGGEELLTSQPENGEYLNQTYFLVEEEWRLHRRFATVRDERLGSIFLMTDGVTDLAYHRRGRTLVPEPGFFDPLTRFLVSRSRPAGEAGIAKILNTERARELVNDDKTLVWLAPA